MSKARYLYSELGTLVQARRNCADKMQQYEAEVKQSAVPRSSAVCYYENAQEWFDKHESRIQSLVKHLMPSGSGIDNGTYIDLDASHATKLVFYFGYHHMNDAGYYDGWTEHKAIVTPSFDGINIRITGRDRNQIKDYLYQTFDCVLNQRVEYNHTTDTYKLMADEVIA